MNMCDVLLVFFRRVRTDLKVSKHVIKDIYTPPPLNVTVLHDMAKGYSVMELRLLGNSLTEVISDNLDRPLVTKKKTLIHRGEAVQR